MALIFDLCLGRRCALLCLQKVTLLSLPPLTAAQVDIWAIKLTVPLRSVDITPR